MNVIRQALRSVNRLLREGGGAIRIDGVPVFSPLPSERVALQTLAASGGVRRWRHIPTIVTGPMAVDRRLSAGPVAASALFHLAAARSATSTPDATLVTTRTSVLVTPPRRSLLQTRRLRPTAIGVAPTASPRHFYNFGHVNARSLAPRMDEINILLQQQQLDILCVSETWLRPDVSSRGCCLQQVNDAVGESLLAKHDVEVARRCNLL